MNDAEIKSFLDGAYGVAADSVDKIEQGVINSNYLIQTPMREFFLFKVYNLREKEQVLFELNLLEYLKEKSFPSPCVIRNREDSLLSDFSSKPCVLLTYIPGRPLQEATAKVLPEIGRRLAEFHLLLKDYEQTVSREMREPENILEYAAGDSQKIIDYGFPDAEELVSYIREELEGMDFPEDLPQGITHQDIKPENIIADDEGHISFIDFDYAYKGVFIYDLMTTVIWSCFKDDELDKEKMAAFLNGYESIRPLEESEKAHFQNALLFRLLREAFIWPWLLLPHEVAKPKSDYFLGLYKKHKAKAI